MSKRPPERVEAPGEVVQLGRGGHGAEYLARKRAGGNAKSFPASYKSSMGRLKPAEDAREQEVLRRSERLLVEAEAWGHVGSWELDAESGELYSSAENRRLFFGPGSCRGGSAEGYFEAIHPEDRERVMRQNEELLAGRGSPEIEFRVIWPDGSVHWIFGQKQVVRDARGKRVREIGTTADIADRKRAEEELARRLREQAAVAELGLSALRGSGVQALFDEAVAAVARTCEVDFTEVMELRPDETLQMRAGVGWRPGVVGSAVPVAGTQCGFALKSGAPVVVEDLRQEGRFSVHQLLLDHGLDSGGTVLIQARDRPWATLAPHSKSPPTS